MHVKIIVTGLVVALLVVTIVVRERASSGRSLGSTAGAAVGPVSDVDSQLLAQRLKSVSARLEKLRAMAPVANDAASLVASARRKARQLRRRIVSQFGQVRRDSLSYDPTDTMFISICSFRDLQCAPTIYDAYEKAKFPRNVFVGAVQQHMPGDLSCVPEQYKMQCTPTEWCPTDNIRTRTIDPTKAKGPTFGRYYGMLMYRDEKYFMMIDSHNRWVTHWDDIVVSMHKGLPTKKGVLAHYPEAWINPEDETTKKETNGPLDNRPTVMYMCTAHWEHDLGFVRMGGHIINRKAKFGKDMCRPQPYAGAGFVFSLGAMVKEVPFDPYLHYVFNGEEIMYSIRMWTHGWDIFSPSENILYHYYYRTNAKKFWSILPPNWLKEREVAHHRLQFMMKTYVWNTTRRHVPDDTKEEAALKELDKYGLGKVRTLEQYYEYAGIDILNHKLTRDFCSEYS